MARGMFVSTHGQLNRNGLGSSKYPEWQAFLMISFDYRVSFYRNIANPGGGQSARVILSYCPFVLCTESAAVISSGNMDHYRNTWV